MCYEAHMLPFGRCIVYRVNTDSSDWIVFTLSNLAKNPSISPFNTKQALLIQNKFYSLYKQERLIDLHYKVGCNYFPDIRESGVVV